MPPGIFIGRWWSLTRTLHKNNLARAMVAQSEQAFLALVQGRNAAAPAVKILEYKEMEPFFVAGDSDAP